jgi:hypothetical protein
MSSAILQGVPATTLDTDLWIDLPEREYLRPVNLSRQLGADMIGQTGVALRDGALVNFLYRVDGLASFATEWKRANEITWCGGATRVVSLEQIIRSKEAILRDKDIAHLPLLKSVLAARKLAQIRP